MKICVENIKKTARVGDILLLTNEMYYLITKLGHREYSLLNLETAELRGEKSFETIADMCEHYNIVSVFNRENVQLHIK